MRRFIGLLLGVVVIACGCSRKPPAVSPGSSPRPGRTASTQPTTKAAQPKPVVRAWKPAACPVDEVNLIVMGDWGSDNAYQRIVSKCMSRYVAGCYLPFNGLLSVGDNLYTPLKRGIDDMEWQKVFEDMYDARTLNMPFYAVLGNHDYEGNKPQVQLDYAARHPDSRWKFPAPWYRLELPAEAPLVTILMLDSDRFKISRQDWARQIAWLEEELAKPRTTRWLIVAAHHPLFSNGLHGDNGLLQVEWGTLLERHNVDFYVAGHEHNLQHLEIKTWPMSFIVAGGGGREKSNMRRDRGPFSRSIYGFVHMRLRADEAMVRYINAKDDSIAHEFYRDPRGNVRVTRTTPNDKGKLSLKPQKPFDESDKVSPFVPTTDPEPPPRLAGK